MAKINFKKALERATGSAIGTALGNGANGVLTKMTEKLDPKIGPVVRAVSLMAVGTMGPDYMGQKGETATWAGGAIASKGAEQFLRIFAPGLISGPEDENVAGPEDEDNMSGIGAEDVVEGPDSENVSGTSENVSGTF